MKAPLNDWPLYLRFNGLRGRQKYAFNWTLSSTVARNGHIIRHVEIVKMT